MSNHLFEISVEMTKSFNIKKLKLNFEVSKQMRTHALIWIKQMKFV
jgi:hypothetical protein